MSNLRCARLLKLSVALALAGPGAITVGCGGDGSGGNVGTGRRRGARKTTAWSSTLTRRALLMATRWVYLPR